MFLAEVAGQTAIVLIL